jgi:hypothetical protein
MDNRTPAIEMLAKRVFTRDALGIWNYALLVAMLLFYTAIILMVAILFSLQQPSGNTGSESATRVMYYAQMAYCVANVIIVFVAAAALIVAREQSQHARRQTQQLIDQNRHLKLSVSLPTLRNIVAEWRKTKFAKPHNPLLMQVGTEMRTFSELRAQLPEATQRINEHLQNLRKEPRANADISEEDCSYSDYMGFLIQIEEIGLLCRNDYIDKQDLVDHIGTSLYTHIALLMDHILWRRKNVDNSPSTFANTLWLFSELEKKTSFTFSLPEETPE